MKKYFLILLISVCASAAVSYLVTSNLSNKNSNSTFFDLDTLADKASRQTANLSGLPDLTYAAGKSVKSVVNIVKREVVESSNRYYGGESYNPFYELFGIPQRGRGRPQERVGGGSGVIVSEDGYIITNNHVIENATSITVTLPTGEDYSARLVGSDPTTDIALIKIDKSGLPAVGYGSSDDLKLGEWVLAVGNPYGLNSTVTAGIVSAKSRNLDVIPSEFRIESFIQTDAAVNPGNSGGALVNQHGELVGINTVIKSPTGSFAGYSFAVPSSIVRKVVDDLKEYGMVQRGLLGIGYAEVNSRFVANNSFGIDKIGGLYIAEVYTNGSADIAGVKRGDILLSIDGQPTNSSSELQEFIARHRPGDELVLKISRSGNDLECKAVLKGVKVER